MGAKVVCLDKEQENVNTDVDLFSLAGVERKPFTVDRTVSHGERFCLAGISFTAWWLPGHTSCSAAYATEGDGEKWLFTGDILFEDSIGRTDFPGGDYDTLICSIRREIFPLADDVKIYPGHGGVTTVGAERAGNPYLS
jgi:hydroxyacylglutathione hydrolase